MQSENSGKFILGTAVIVVILIVIVNLILNNMTAYIDSAAMPPKMDEASINERLKPVGTEIIGEEPVVAAAADNGEAVPVADAEDGAIGQQIVTQACAACHASGLMDSPRIGNARDWAPRLEQGMDTLYANAINGINMMPARGGNPKLTDEEVKAAVDYMLVGAQ
jgi:cytochrome c5